MLKKMQALKNKKGFTLIEVIVVLIIVAVLAAVAVPSMIGFVEDARGKAFAAEARVGLVAAQAALTQRVASGTTVAAGTYPPVSNDLFTAPLLTSFRNMTSDVTGLDSSSPVRVNGFSGIVVGDNNRVTGITYTAVQTGRTYTVVILNGEATVNVSNTA